MARSYFAYQKELAEVQPYLNPLGAFKPHLEHGDLGVAFSWDGDDVSFIGQSSVNVLEEREDDNGGRFQLITFGTFDLFSEPRHLSVLAGSLERVYRFLTPERHFTRPIVKLSYNDFDAISSNAIDMDRSVYRYLFSALPIELQSDFIRRNINSFFISPQGQVTNYKSICREIITYYTTHITDAMEIMSLAAEQLNQLVGIEGLTQPSEFVLSDNGDDYIIPFGRVVNQVSRAYKFNPIFTARQEPASLIDQARKQVEIFQEPNNVTSVMRDRTWNDPIF